MFNYYHIGQGFYYVSDKEAGLLSKHANSKLPRIGYLLELPKFVTDGLYMGTGLRIRALIRISSNYYKRGWHWAVF